MNKKYDLVVVGGGIAGLAIGEIFARSGFKVALLEKDDKLCMGDSGVHHEWFHFGSLYSIFPNNQFLRTLVGSIDDILVYYRDLEGMNLRVTSDGKLITVENGCNWFREDTIEYVVAARNDPDFELKKFSGIKDFLNKLIKLLYWERCIKQFIARHNRFYSYDWRRGVASHYIPKAGLYDYSRVVISKFQDDKIRLDPDTHFRIKGYDKPMISSNIITDLIRSLKSSGGDIFLNSRFIDYNNRSNGIEVVSENGVLRTDKLILALGKDLGGTHQTESKIDVFVSPLLVVYPNVCDINFVRLTPFVTKTINHIKHSVEGKTYSLIGGGYFASPEDPEEKERVQRYLVDRAKLVFPMIKEAKILEVYFGNKTEVASSLKDIKKRNYLYRIERIDRDVYFVVPGKFSLGFSLAVNTFKELVGHYPNTYVIYDRNIDVEEYIGLMRHRSMVLNNS
ncbi:MAG: FAD-dependent oxidoreductase [Thermodesulfobacteriota bacterium]